MTPRLAGLTQGKVRRDDAAVCRRTRGHCRGARARACPTLGDATIATAILDRLLPHSHLINIWGESHRLRKGQAELLWATAASASTNETTDINPPRVDEFQTGAVGSKVRRR